MELKNQDQVKAEQNVPPAMSHAALVPCSGHGYKHREDRIEDDMLLQSKALHKLRIVKFLSDGPCCIECAIRNKFYMLGAWDGIFFMGRIGSI